MMQLDVYGQIVNLKLSQANDKTDWSEITLKDAVDLLAHAKDNLPKEIERYYQLQYMDKGDSKVKSELENITLNLPSEVEHVGFPEFQGGCIKILSDISEESLNKMNALERLTIYRSFIEVPMMGLLNNPDFEPKGIESFVHNGVTYYLPKDADGYGVNVPMGADTTTIEFAESATLMMNSSNMKYNKMDNIALVIAILARPQKNGKREAYDQAKAIQRANEFINLPMEIVWEVFFCFTELLHTSKTLGQIYMKAQVAEE